MGLEREVLRRKHGLLIANLFLLLGIFFGGFGFIWQFLESSLGLSQQAYFALQSIAGTC